MEEPIGPTTLTSCSFRVGGMTCTACQHRIENKLKNTEGIYTVSVHYETGITKLHYDASIINFSQIAAIIEDLGYKVEEEKSPVQAVVRVAGVLLIILALSMLLRAWGTSALITAFPLAQVGMGYGMLLVIGLLTSVHCVAMCGGINLSQTLRGSGEQRVENKPSRLPPLFPGMLYSAGRLISYTAVGIAAGAIGSAITLPAHFQGAALLLAGGFMLIMGINMLGIFPALKRITPRLLKKAHMPHFLTEKVNGQRAKKGPLLVGILNGFMPCGPLQAMQFYALSTGSPARGGLSMFLFCMGTIPLTFALGAAGGMLSGAFSRRIMRAGAVIIAAMGLTMLVNGWNSSGLYSLFNRTAGLFRRDSATAKGDAFMPVIQNGVQIVNSTLLPNRYPAITVQEGIPVRWTINAPPGSINGCNNRFFIRQYGIEYTLKPGDNVIEFFPAKAGRFRYSCWMSMIHSTIAVLNPGESAGKTAGEPDITPVPAGVVIPTDTVALAQVAALSGNFQIIEIELSDDGFDPAIVVMQRNLPALWTINNHSLDPGNNSLIFPVYYAMLETRQGANVLQLMPDQDFEFSTGDNIFYGFVKVVDDINRIDIEAIKAEVADHETLVYPEAYFEMAAQSGGCCSM